MDINLVRTGVTVVSLVLFLGIVLWAYRPAHKSRFEADGLSVLLDNDKKE